MGGMADIFLSYRREDSRSATGRLADGLQAVFGPQRVFRDLDSIAPGQDFQAALDGAGISGSPAVSPASTSRRTKSRGSSRRRRPAASRASAQRGPTTTSIALAAPSVLASLGGLLRAAAWAAGLDAA
jgi:hypothetical protein